MKTPKLILLLCLAACSGQKANETVEEAPALTPSKYILDSLLVYDSEQALIERFGSKNISRDTAWLPEGMGQYLVTVLYPGTNNEVTFEWADSASFSSLDAVTVTTDSSEWTSNGVKVGTNLVELVELNGGDFTFSGFGWDYGGNATFGDGRLSGLSIVLESSEKMMAQEQQDSLMGDRSVSSKSAAARLNNPEVRVLKLVRERD